MAYSDLSGHTNSLVTLVGVGWTVAAIIGWKFFWAFLARIEKKLDDHQATQAKCQAELPEKYASWQVLTGPEGLITEIRKDRKERWLEFDRHKHDGCSGEVLK